MWGMTVGTRIILSVVAGLLLLAVPVWGRTIFVDTHHPRANDAGPGTKTVPFRTIGAAAQQAKPGDTILVSSGVYREHVAPLRGGESRRLITYQAMDKNGPVIVTGADVWKPIWTPQDGGVWRAALDSTLWNGAEGGNPFASVVRPSRGGGTLGQIFRGGKLLPPAKTPDVFAKMPEGWLAQKDGSAVQVRLPRGVRPPEEAWEISTRQRVFAPRKRGLGYITVRGFVFEKAANDVAFPQMGMVDTRSGHHWVIENCVIRYANAIGLDVGGEFLIWTRAEEADNQKHVDGSGHHTIRNNTVTDCGQCGIAGWNTPGTRISHNFVARNGGLIPGFESGGIKCHLLFDGVVENNTVVDNEAWGIWLDTGYQGARVAGNLCVNNKEAGIFIELGQQAMVVENNVVLNTRGSGIYTHDASDVIVRHNFVAGSQGFGVFMRVATDRASEVSGVVQAESSRQFIENNLFASNTDGAISLPLPAPRARANHSNHNFFAAATVETVQTVHFSVNPENGIKTLSADLLNDMGAGALSTEARAALQNKKGVSLTLSEWRKTMKMDETSLVTLPIRWAVDAPKASVMVSLSQSILFASGMPPSFYLARLHKSENRWVDWPVEKIVPPLPVPTD